MSLFIKSNNLLSSYLLEYLKNIDVYSPLGLNFLISLLSKGVDGNTLDQISNVFGTNCSNICSFLQDMKKLNTIYNKKNIKLINAIFVNNSVKLSKDYYNTLVNEMCEVGRFSFSNYSNQTINQWVSIQTDGMISNILEQNTINDNTQMVLISTLVFKNLWKNAFESVNTKNQNFYSFDLIKKINIMSNCLNAPYCENENFQLLELPFKNQQYSMGFLLPKQINYLKIDSSNLLELIESLSTTYVNVSIPKFKHHCKIDLIPILKSLGITNLFNSNRGALHILEYESNNLSVDVMIQEVIVEIDENGINTLDTPIDDRFLKVAYSSCKFVADHPFMYYVRDRTNNCILFMGRYH